MNHTILLVLVLTLLSSFPARAQEDLPPFGSYKALGAGAQVVCGAFIAEMGKGPQADQLLGHTVISWVHGYVTAYNETLSKSPEIKGDLSKGFTELDVINMIADHCAREPKQIIALAAHEVIMFLFQLRSAAGTPATR